MSSLPQADHQLDCRGALCPMPVIRLREQIGNMSDGEVVHVLATDPASVHDMPAFARNTGHELLESIRGDGFFEFYFRKTGGG